MSKDETLYRIKEIADRLNQSQKVIRKHIFAGSLISDKKAGVHYISESHLQEFIRSLNAVEVIDLLADPDNSKTKKKDHINWVGISKEWESPSRSTYTSADLFCGAGGMAYGFQMAGFKPLCGLDYFREAGDTYKRNFKHPHILGDITEESVKQKFIETVEQQLKGKRLTVLSGGFPCQGFSMSGSRIVEDKRNSLYKDMLDIIDRLQPEWIVAENVKGLRSMLKGKVEEKILEDIRALGYKVNVTVLNAADYHVPQKRERIIFIANKIDKLNCHPAPLLQPSEYVTTKAAIADLISVSNDKSFNHVRAKHSPKMKLRLAAVAEGDSLYDNYSDSWKKCPWDAASCTIKENHGGVNIHPIEPRVITVREMARLQSFPDDFIFEGSKSKQMVQIGNAVPPLLSKAIGLAIRVAMKM